MLPACAEETAANNEHITSTGAQNLTFVDIKALKDSGATGRVSFHRLFLPVYKFFAHLLDSHDRRIGDYPEADRRTQSIRAQDGILEREIPQAERSKVSERFLSRSFYASS
jgi:hypothetical protein